MISTYVEHALARFRDEEEGQTLTEYGLILFVIAVALTLSLTLLRDDLKSLFNSVSSALGGPTIS
jgi:Flp pilus assembly pilin Flp